jgi:hypothetical protein
MILHYFNSLIQNLYHANFCKIHAMIRRGKIYYENKNMINIINFFSLNYVPDTWQLLIQWNLSKLKQVLGLWCLMPLYPLPLSRGINMVPRWFSLESSWSWSYGIWIYNYLRNQFLSKVWTLFIAKCTRYNIMWWSLSMTCDRTVI